MRDIFVKELKLGASPLSYFFIAFGLMFLLPGYPVLCAVFFVTLGLMHSFQKTRETNDIVFSALLPIAKKDVVSGKYLFACFIEGCSVLPMLLSVVLRMTVLAGAKPYTDNALMNANLFALGMAFFIFGLFNSVFIGSFFRTAYKIGRPFVVYVVFAFLTIGLAEALHHFPGLGALNAFGFDRIGLQAATLAVGILLFALMTVLSYKRACRSFEKLDL